jgi:hypothetical protein
MTRKRAPGVVRLSLSARRIYQHGAPALHTACDRRPPFVSQASDDTLTLPAKVTPALTARVNTHSTVLGQTALLQHRQEAIHQVYRSLVPVPRHSTLDTETAPPD